MDVHRGPPPGDVSAEQRASNEKIKLIRKLRWIGMEAEARRLQVTLDGATGRTDCVIAEPRETD
jgi:hypothetical protein